MAQLSVNLSPSQMPRPRLPDRIKVLYVTTLHRTGNWLAEAFSADNATQVTMRETIGVTAGMAMLRDEVFDAILVSHEPGVLDALDFVEALRTGGHDEPIIVLGQDRPEVFEALVYEVGGDAYCWVEQTTTRSLLWEFARAIRRYELVRENRRLMEAERQRLSSEHAEAERLLAEQRALVSDLEAIETEASTSESPIRQLANGAAHDRPGHRLPSNLVKHYRDMLQAYVVMGSGNLTKEMAGLSDVLATAAVSAHQAMHLHVEVLEEMIQGLGRRSARHVMNRADLLVMEVMVHLADGYRHRFLDRTTPPTQQLLPGFDAEDVGPTQPVRQESDDEPRYAARFVGDAA